MIKWILNKAEVDILKVSTWENFLGLRSGYFDSTETLLKSTKIEKRWYKV